jgi:hypothetical protein
MAAREAELEARISGRVKWTARVIRKVGGSHADALGPVQDLAGTVAPSKGKRILRIVLGKICRESVVLFVGSSAEVSQWQLPGRKSTAR